MEKIIDCTLEDEGFIGHFYPGTSHALVDGIDAFSGMTKFVFKKMIPAEKNYPVECEEARQDSLKRILKFIEEWQ